MAKGGAIVESIRIKTLSKKNEDPAHIDTYIQYIYPTNVRRDIFYRRRTLWQRDPGPGGITQKNTTQKTHTTPLPSCHLLESQAHIVRHLTAFLGSKGSVVNGGFCYHLSGRPRPRCQRQPCSSAERASALRAFGDRLRRAAVSAGGPSAYDFDVAIIGRHMCVVVGSIGGWKRAMALGSPPAAFR